jgi:hypothetical protein
VTRGNEVDGGERTERAEETVCIRVLRSLETR